MKTNKIFFRKNGEMTSTQIATIILILVGFVILLAFFYKFNFSDEIDRDTCHESVILRGTLPTAAQDTIPLKCSPKLICVTQKTFGKGECNNFGADKRMNTVKVSKKENIEKLIADEMVSCWSMMGQGKLSLFSKTSNELFGTDTYPTCVICSRIAFDEDNLKSIDKSTIDTLGYMRKYKVPGQEVSYANYFNNQKGSVSVKDNLITFSLSNTDNMEIDKSQSSPDDEFSNEVAIIFMQISSPTTGKAASSISKILLGAGAISTLTAPIKTTQTVWGLSKFCATSFYGAAICGGIATILGGALKLSVDRSQGVSATYCGDVKFGSESGTGCSVVRTMNYDIEDIKKYCSVIEGLS